MPMRLSLSFYRVGVYLAVLVAFALPNTALASLDAAFSSLTGSSTTSGGGAFATSTRTGYALPGGTMRFQTNTYSLVRTEPASLEIGCNGIDAHLGSLTFLNGEQIERMLDEISNSTAMLFLLALKNLCGICGTVLEWAEQVAQMANQMTLNSCEVGQMILDRAAEAGQSLACSTFATEIYNEDDDFLASKSNTCSDQESASQRTSEGLADQSDADRAAHVEISGNVTWKLLQETGLAPKSSSDPQSMVVAELFMSWIGTNISGEIGYPSAFIDSAQFLNIFLCGVKNESELASFTGPVRSSIEAFCRSVWEDDGYDGIEFYRCEASAHYADPATACETVGKQSLADSSMGSGFIVHVASTLFEAAQYASESRALEPRHMNLIASAPFPLYQGVNIASTHPEIGENLLMSYSVILAHQMGIEYIRHVLREAGQATEGTTLPARLMREAAEQQQRLTAATDQVINNINIYSEMHNTITYTVQRIQQEMVKNARSSGLSGFEFAADLAALEESVP